MKDIIMYTIHIVIFALAVVGLSFLVFKALEKNEAKQCLTWQAQATEHQTFYWTDWQKEQCEHVNQLVKN